MTYANYETFLKQDFHEYAGKWVAIINKKVVASERDVNKLILKVKKDHPHEVPFIARIRNKLAILCNN